MRVVERGGGERGGVIEGQRNGWMDGGRLGGARKAGYWIFFG